MGSGASSLPDQLNEEQLKIIASSQFQDGIHVSLQDPDGSVPKDLFIQCFEEGPESEVFHLFMAYCPNGQMDNISFLTLCRDSKLLNKNTCTSAMAANAFDHALRLQSKTIGYNQFRRQVVPEFAKLKIISEEALIDRLSLCEFPSPVAVAGAKTSLKITPREFSSENTLIPGVVAVTVIEPPSDPTASSSMLQPAVTGTREGQVAPLAPLTLISSQISLGISVEFIKALKCLQAIARAKIAKRKVAALKEVRDIETGKSTSRRPTIEPEITKRRQSRDNNDSRIKSLLVEQEAMKKEIKQLMGQEVGEDSGINEINSFEEEEEIELTPAQVEEQSLHDLFDHYCNPPGEMDINFFKKFMRETFTVTKKFTLNDVDAIFKKAIAKATAAPQNSQMCNGVFYGKRMNFYVFFHSAIPMSATQRDNTTKQQLISYLINANVAVRSRDEKKKQASRKSSRDEHPRPSRKPSREIAPAHLPSRDNDLNPFSRKHPSADILGGNKGISSTPRRSFDSSTGPRSAARRSFDNGVR